MANRIANPSFETDLSGWLQDAFVSTTLQRDSAWASDGSWSALLSFTDATPGRASGWRTPTGTSGIPVTVGDRMLIQADVVISSPQQGAFVRVYWYTAAGASVSNSTSPLRTTSGPINYEVQVPATAAFASIGFGGQSNGGLFDAYFDNIRFDNNLVPGFSSAGAVDAGTVTSGAAWDPACPSTINAGDLLIAHVSCRNLTTDPVTPAGWTLLAGPYSTSVGRHWLFGKVADGTEDSTAVSFGTQATVNNRSGRIYRFVGHDWTGQNIANVVTGFAHGAGTTAAVTDTAVTTPVANCLACNFFKADDNNTIGAFTGMTGGTWAAATGVASNNLDTGWMAHLQIASMYSPGTIDGGSVTMSAADPWGDIGCYIRPPITTPPAADTDNFFAFI